MVGQGYRLAHVFALLTLLSGGGFLHGPLLEWRGTGKAGYCNRRPAYSAKKRLNITMNITNKEIGGVSVVAFNGRIVLGEESTALREKVKSLLGAGKKRIVLDMSNVTYIDSAGLGILVAAHVSAQKQGAALHLSNLGNKFHDVLQLTRLLTVFSVYDTEADAISTFGTSSLAATL